MTFVSSLCFVIAFFIGVSCLPRGADVFSPARVYGFMWSVALGLADLKFSAYQHAWGTFAWIAMLLGIVSFLLGVFFVEVLCLEQKMFSVENVRDHIKKELFSVGVLFNMIILLFACYSVGYIIEWLAFGVLPIFAPFPEKARIEYGVFGVHLFQSLMPIILFLIVEFFMLVRKAPIRKILLVLVFFVTFVSYFLLLNRFIYAMVFFMVIGFAYYSSRIVKFKYLTVPILLLLAAMIYLQSIRESHYVENYLYVVSRMRFSKTYAALTTPYMYIVMNLENFARASERLGRHAYGYFSFDVVLALTGLKHWIEDYFSLKERVFLNSGYNTFPYFWDYYYDFGVFGIAFVPALVGATFAWLHKRMRTRPSISSVALYSVAVFVMVLSFFTNTLSSLNFVFAVIALVAVQSVIRRLSSNARRASFDAFGPEVRVR